MPPCLYMLPQIPFGMKPQLSDLKPFCVLKRNVQRLRFSPGNFLCYGQRKGERAENIYTQQVRGELPTFCCFPQHVYKATTNCGEDQRESELKNQNLTLPYGIGQFCSQDLFLY